MRSKIAMGDSTPLSDDEDDIITTRERDAQQHCHNENNPPRDRSTNGDHDPHFLSARSVPDRYVRPTDRTKPKLPSRNCQAHSRFVPALPTTAGMPQFAQRIRSVTGTHFPSTGYSALTEGTWHAAGSMRTCFARTVWPETVVVMTIQAVTSAALMELSPAAIDADALDVGAIVVGRRDPGARFGNDGSAFGREGHGHSGRRRASAYSA
jgi:hypothetical protein